jgi:putative flippase GtrA
MSNAGRSWSRFGKFNLVGLLGAALQMFLLWLLIKRFQVPALAATPVAVEIVVLHNLAWHELFTWRDRPAKNLRQKMVRLWRFHAANGLTSLLGNTAVIYGLVQWVHAPLVLSAIVAIVLCSLVNFLVADRWAFATIADLRSGAQRS